MLDKYGLDNHITRLDNAQLLYQVVARFAELDLRPETVSNHAMGYMFEELLRRFSEMSNETAGEHFTPREVIKLMVNILFSEDDDALRGTAPVRTLYDPACGTGGMLTAGQDRLTEMNPSARLEVFGQELNPETWAIARSDLMIKGQDPARIVLGNSFTDDGFAGKHFDYALANPPFGVDWKRIERQVRDEHEQLGERGRFGAGLPRVSDGSLMFLQHMIDKMRPSDKGGSRIAIVFSGSPLFSGAAGSGESEIRRWIIENDWLEAVVALPDQLFYNTSISTYFWVVTNRKRSERQGRVALIDAREQWTRMRKSLGEKRKEISDEQIDLITKLYSDAPNLGDADDRVKVCDNDSFGYQRITVERPMRRRWEVMAATIEQVKASKPYIGFVAACVAGVDGHTIGDEQLALDVLLDLLGSPEQTQAALAKRLDNACTAHNVVLTAAMKKAALDAAAVSDSEGPLMTDRRGRPLADPDLRDNENVPLTEDVDSYMAREVLPHVPDAWVDNDKTKIGFEIPFTRHFYRFTPPRPVPEIDAELDVIETEIQDVLRGVAR